MFFMIDIIILIIEDLSTICIIVTRDKNTFYYI